MNKGKLSPQAKQVVETINNFLKELPTEEEIRKNYFEAENLLALIGNIRRIKKELKNGAIAVSINFLLYNNFSN